jgi:hypothetical protein
MSAWTLIPCLDLLFDEFDHEAPHRDRGSDGRIGDASHTSSSDHTPDEDSDKLRSKDADNVNEVHAADVDSSGPWPDGQRGDIKGSWFDRKIHHLIDLEREKWRDPNDMCRLNYVIWFDQIFDKDNDFQPQPYTATSDPHTGHAHFSGRYETRAESDTRPWGIEDEMDKATFMAWMKEFHEKTNEGFATHAINGIGGAGPVYQTLADAAGRTNIIKSDTAQIRADLKTLTGMVDALDEKLDAHNAGLIEGEQQPG